MICPRGLQHQAGFIGAFASSILNQKDKKLGLDPQVAWGNFRVKDHVESSASINNGNNLSLFWHFYNFKQTLRFECLA
jgi:hypothetical protein